MDRGGAGDRLDPGHRSTDVIGEIGLVENDDRLGARTPGQAEIALEPARVQVMVERGHDEQEVDVGGEDLLVGRPVARCPADDCRAPGEETLDQPLTGVAGRLEHDPVADDGESGSPVELGVEAEPARHRRPGLSVARPDEVRPAILDEDPARLLAVDGLGREGQCVSIVPAPVGEGGPAAHRVTAGRSTGPW